MQPWVLLVDDDPEFLASVRDALEPAGMRISAAETGEAALELLESDGAGVQAAIVDLDLPTMSGFDLIREIRARHGHVRIMAVTAIYKGLYLEVARNVGANIARRKTNEGTRLSAAEWQALVQELLT